MYVPASTYNRVKNFCWIEFSFFVDMVSRINLLDFSLKPDRDLILTYIHNTSSRNVLDNNVRFPVNYTLVSLKISPLNKIFSKIISLCSIPRNLDQIDFLKYFDDYTENLQKLNNIIESEEISYHTLKFEKKFNLVWESSTG